MLKDKSRYRKIYKLDNSVPSRQLILFTISSFFAGKPEASQNLVYYLSTRDIEIPKNFENSIFRVGAHPTSNANLKIYIQRGNVQSHVANIDISALSHTGTFTTVIGANHKLYRGDSLLIVAPSTQDTSMSDISITIAGDLL